MTDEQRVETEIDTQDFLRKLHEAREMNQQDKDKIETDMAYYLGILERLETKFDRTLPVIKSCTEYYMKQINKCLEELNGK